METMGSDANGPAGNGWFEGYKLGPIDVSKVHASNEHTREQERYEAGYKAGYQAGCSNGGGGAKAGTR